MTPEQKKEEWRNQTSPYIFVLKEGPSHQKNLLDYSLCMMQIRAEAFHPPQTKLIISSRNKFDSRIGHSPSSMKS